jgi:ADP-ribose pyrophosphatase
LKYNQIDRKYDCDRRSHHGEYKIKHNQSFNKAVPLNPVGRTGIIGRGHLGKWGPNHAAGKTSFSYS